MAKCFHPDSFAGPRTLLFDLRVVDDPHVQRRADRDGTILHVRGRRLRQSHGERRRNSKPDIITSANEVMGAGWGGFNHSRCEWTDCGTWLPRPGVTVSQCPGL